MSAKYRFGSTENNTSIDKLTGEMSFEGEAGGWGYLEGSIGRNEVNFFTTKPDLDAVNGYLLLDPDDDEPFLWVRKMPLSWLEGSPIALYLKWIQENPADVAFWAEKKIFSNGQQEGVWSDKSYAVGTNYFPYTSGSLAQITTFDLTSMQGMTGATNIILNISRDTANDSYPGDVKLHGIGILYRIGNISGMKNPFGTRRS